MSELSKNFNALTPKEQTEIKEFLFKNNNILVDVGDYIIGSGGNPSVYRVTNIKKTQYKRWKKTYNKGEQEFEMVDDVEIVCGGRASYNSSSFSSQYSVWKGTLEELEQSASEFMTNKVEQPKKDNSEAGLMSFDKKAFTDLKTSLVIKAQQMQSKMSMAQQMLQKKRFELQEILEPMLKEIKRITTIIWTIELYLGIKEDIMLVNKGEEAPIDEPINLMQERLYMDEELGDPTDGGLDINSTEDFYDWLLTKSNYYKCFNYELLLPYKKSVRIMRVRRERKEYGDKWTNISMTDPNFETIILIRNGETIYSIETQMRFGDKLFPAETELMDLRNKIIADNERYTSINGRKLDEEYKEERIKKGMQDEVDRYKRNFIIMQGLIDRTEVFGKLFGKVNLMSGSAIEKGQVVFNYDADTSNIIGDGDINFIDKMRSVLENIGAGTRVLHFVSWSDKDNEYDFFKLPYVYNRYFYPDRPQNGAVRNLLYDKDYKCLYFKYLPTEEYYDRSTGTYKVRKNRVSFRVDVELNKTIDVDAFSHRDMDWLVKMMHDRRQRKHYSRYMFILKEIIRYKKKELEEEKPFAMLVMSQNNCTELEALDSIFWWKTKNKYKRGLTVDDAKALRMINKYLKSK